MIVRKLVLRGFMAHDDSTLELPERGVVLVTGANGSGKSAIIEAVAAACWGETLRGTVPWRAGSAGSVRVETPTLVAERTVTAGGKKALTWAVGGQQTTFETTTKAQAALERVIGSFDVWRRSAVFSSQDAAHFTLATDAERKRMLEEVLGIGRFDAALARCRADLTKVERASHTHDIDEARLRERVAAAVRRADEATRALEAVPPGLDEPAATTRLGVLQDAQRATDQQLREATRALGALGGDAGRLAERRSAAERRLRTLSADACPTCEQVIPKALKARLLEDAQALREQENDAARVEAERRAEVEERIDDLRDDLRGVSDKIAALKQTIAESRAARRQIEAARAEADTAAQEVGAITAQLDALQRERAVVAQDAATLGTVERVLGLRGVRAHLLGSALDGIEQAANVWLDRVAGSGMALRLKPYTERKSGGASESISLDVIGAGGGYGYRAASAGQRRRIDVALLFALAEVAAAARGVQPGTLFVDEVADGLDVDGMDAVGAVLGELAQDRAVVIISHRPELASVLPSVAGYRVAQGRLTDDARAARD